MTTKSKISDLHGAVISVRIKNKGHKTVGAAAVEIPFNSQGFSQQNLLEACQRAAASAMENVLDRYIESPPKTKK